MAIEELMAVIPPPLEPVETGDEAAWRIVQQSIGMELPDDLRDIGMRYGSGRFYGGFLIIFNPFSPRYKNCIDHGAKRLRIHQSEFSEPVPFRIFPDRPGLLAIGADENGNKLHWLTEGDPNDWPVIAEAHGGPFERYDMALTTFLARAFKNEILPKYCWWPFSAKYLDFEPDPPDNP